MQTTVRYPLFLLALVCLATAGALAAEAGAPLRAPIPPEAFRAEIGFCYIATMDFGEDGDKESGNRSQLVVLEDGKPLGPGRSLHDDIRQRGAGRFSHWTRTALYLSASDNSDPRGNGRRYEVVTANPESELPGSVPATGAPHEHCELVTTSRHEYAVRMGGQVDFENGRSRFNSGLRVAFQPNLSLTIANVGETPVRWPKVIANGQGDWGTIESLVAEFTRGAQSQQDRALFIWENTRHARYHCLPLFPDDEFHDPVKLLNCYGLNLCDDLGYVGAMLFRAAGLGKPTNPEEPFVRALNGHVQGETMVDGHFAFMDIDEEVFHWDRENLRLVSGDEVVADHDLSRREVHYGPEFGGWEGGESNAAIFGADDTRHRHFVQGHTMDYTLRPGEQVELRWGNAGKYACHSQEWDHKPPCFGNSLITCVPRLGPEQYREGIAAERDIVPGSGVVALVGASPEAQLVYEVRSPWVICGGTVSAGFVAATAQDAVSIALELPGCEPKRVYEARGPGLLSPTIVTLDEALQPHQAPGKYAYRVVIGLHSAAGSAGAGLKSLRFDTDVMAAPLSLPRLRLGQNRLVYTDLSEGPRRLEVTHRWQECHEVAPPPAPQQALSPAPGSTSRETFPALAWTEVPKARAYHVQMSLRPDFAIPYRPNYDLVVRSSSWSVPFRGMFSPETLYHWRVKARSTRGIWSDWSPVWTFRWQGPMVPRNVRVEPQGEEFVLRWEPNPRGERPVAYKVYGSDEKGFPEHDEPYRGYCRGDVPANLLGKTEATEMVVVTPTPNHANQNRCFYRVVAVDAHGTESASSASAELPHPHLWSRPPAMARVGEEWRYAPGVLTSLGDAQHRSNEKPVVALRDSEANRFELAEGPAWLRCNPETGELNGAPDAAGDVAVRVTVSNQFGRRTEQGFALRVEP